MRSSWQRWNDMVLSLLFQLEGMLCTLFVPFLFIHIMFCSIPVYSYCAVTCWMLSFALLNVWSYDWFNIATHSCIRFLQLIEFLYNLQFELHSHLFQLAENVWRCLKKSLFSPIKSSWTGICVLPWVNWDLLPSFEFWQLYKFSKKVVFFWCVCARVCLCLK